jgi:ABC-type proline/glycine betaine transport system substrate-binding protein
MASGHRFARTGPLLLLLAGLLLAAQVAVAEPAKEEMDEMAGAPDCNGIDRELVFAGLDWSSAQVHNYVAGTILQAGFGCEFTDIPGSTIPMVQGLVRGDIDINMEIWFNSAPDMYHGAAARGEVLDLGLNMSALELSFLVPRYVIEGDAERGIAAMAPDLKSVADLPGYAQVFQDPEQPDMGRFYNCIIGWQCELINNDKMATYGLDEHFTNFRPGTSAALAASLSGSYEKGEAWLGYYWGPTWVLGTYDMVVLEEPAYSDDCWVEGDRGCGFPPSIVNVAVSKDFAEAASEEMVEFLRTYEMDQLLVSELLAYMRENDVEAIDAARYFLENRADIWTAWVSDDVAARVQDSLN